jgi:hypothetical protein
MADDCICVGWDIGLGNDLHISSRRTNKRMESLPFSCSTFDVFFDIGVFGLGVCLFYQMAGNTFLSWMCLNH